MALSRVVPGQVRNDGIYDGSRTTVTLAERTFPAHYFNIGLITPKGPLGQFDINSADFTSICGDIQDPNSPYYTPASVFLAQVTANGQSSYGIRGLSGNTVKARVVIAVSIVKEDIDQFQRNADGTLTLGGDGRPVVIGQAPGITINRVLLKTQKEPGSLQRTTVENGGVTTITYPLFELPSGVGDYYNNCGVELGVASSTDWRSVSDFVETNGVFPFSIRMFTKQTNGTYVYDSTRDGSGNTAIFPAFAFTSKTGTNYGPKQTIGAFTGDNVNRPHISYPASVNEVYSYDANIEELCRTLYLMELSNPENQLLTEVTKPYRQMNFLTGFNHKGVPYYNIATTDDMNVFHMNTRIFCEGGISRFKDKDGKYIVPVELPPDPFGLRLPGEEAEFTRKEGWEALQKLTLQDTVEYANSSYIINWERNRQSVIWDIGYNTDIKDAMIELWSKRKDQILVLHAGVYGQDLSIAERYSMAQGYATKLRLYPESVKFGTPALRASINLWDGKVINEATGDTFTMNMDLAGRFANMGGAGTGIMVSANGINAGNNRYVSAMYDPTIYYEEDDPAANNFDSGFISLRGRNDGQYWRSATPTVYNNGDSVCKDLDTAFVATCIEKTGADQWHKVCNDSTLDSEAYASTTKDNVESECRKLYGSLFDDIVAEATYSEGTANSRAILNLVIKVWFRKQKYTMNMELHAFNEQDLRVAA